MVGVVEVAVHQGQAVELGQGEQLGQGQAAGELLVVLHVQVEQVLQGTDRAGQWAGQLIAL